MTNHFAADCRTTRSQTSLRQRMNQYAGLAILLAFALTLAQPSLGQQANNGDEAKAPVTRKKAAGRLPAYFSAVVSQKQRESIYKLQADFDDQLEKLRAQMDTLIAERDQAIDGVLSAEQLAEVNKKRDESKKKRAARSNAAPEPEAPAGS